MHAVLGRFLGLFFRFMNERGTRRGVVRGQHSHSSPRAAARLATEGASVYPTDARVRGNGVPVRWRFCIDKRIGETQSDMLCGLARAIVVIRCHAQSHYI